MDRNVWDIALQDSIRGESFKPKDFFKSNWAIYIHEKNLRGKLVFSFELEEDIEYININNFDLNNICQTNFEFDIEYKHHYWYPLDNEYLPASDPQGFSQFPWTYQKQHWTSFPRETRVGWRGHMVLWSKLDELPNIIWQFPKEILKAFECENARTVERTFKIVTDNELINVFFSQTEIKRNVTQLNNEEDSDESEEIDEDFILKSVCNATTSKDAARYFAWNVKDKMKINNMQFPITFNIDVIEQTETSNKQTYKYSITCEADQPWIDNCRILGKILISKIIL
jgi:hypothetical protein